MLSTLVALYWLYFGGGRWASVSAQHAERQVGHTSLPIPPDPGLIGVILTSSSASSHMTSSFSTPSHVMTSTTSRQTPSSTYYQLSMDPVENMTTCAPGIVTWTYNGPSRNISLYITNVNVLDTYPQRDLTRRQDNAGQISVTLTVTDSSLNSWTWPQVDQPQGWYAIDGFVASLNASSTPFFISNGSDTTCLLSSSSSSLGPTSIATAVATSSTTLSSDKIVGVVVGSLVVCLLLVLAIAYYLYRRCRSPTRSSKPKQSVGKRWSSLKSNDSTARSLARGNDGATHSHGHSDAIGEILIVADSGKASETTTTRGSDECHGTRGEEKEAYPHLPGGMISVDALDDPLSRHNYPTSVYSLQDPGPFPDPSPHGSRTRATSACYSERNLELQAARIRSSMQSYMYLRTEHLSSTALAFSIPSTPTPPRRGRDEYPPSPTAETSARRSPSTGAVSARRISRKPVPHYDASEFPDLRSAADNQTMFTAGESSHSHGTESLSPLHGMSTPSPNRVYHLIPDIPPSRDE